MSCRTGAACVLMPDGHILSVLSESMQSTRGGIFNFPRIGSTKSPLFPSGCTIYATANEARLCFSLLRTQLYRLSLIFAMLISACTNVHYTASLTRDETACGRKKHRKATTEALRCFAFTRKAVRETYGINNIWICVVGHQGLEPWTDRL